MGLTRWELRDRDRVLKYERGLSISLTLDHSMQTSLQLSHQRMSRSTHRELNGLQLRFGSRMSLKMTIEFLCISISRSFKCRYQDIVFKHFLKAVEHHSEEGYLVNSSLVTICRYSLCFLFPWFRRALEIRNSQVLVQNCSKQASRTKHSVFFTRSCE